MCEFQKDLEKIWKNGFPVSAGNVLEGRSKVDRAQMFEWLICLFLCIFWGLDCLATTILRAHLLFVRYIWIHTQRTSTIPAKPPVSLT